MRNLFVFLLTCIVVISLSGCGEEDKIDDQTKSETSKSESAEQVNSSETNQSTEKAVQTEEQKTEEQNIEEQNEEKNESNDQVVEQGINFLQYRPEVGSKKSFTEKGELVFTEEIIAANDEYVQTLLQLGDNKTTQIYRWTKDEITLIYEDYNLEDPQKDILNEFVPIEKFETIMNNDSSKVTNMEISFK